MSDPADAIASELEAGISEARMRQRIDRRLAEADVMERELAFFNAGIPLHQPVAELFLSAYDGPLDADAIQSAWYRQVLDQPVPRDVTQRIEARRIAADLRAPLKEK
jgi:hypothetical protein